MCNAHRAYLRNYTFMNLAAFIKTEWITDFPRVVDNNKCYSPIVSGGGADNQFLGISEKHKC